jgi:hypothetical protein
MRRRTFNPVETRTTADIDSAFRAATKEADQAVILLPAPFMGRNASQLADLALANRLPTFKPLPPHALLQGQAGRNQIFRPVRHERPSTLLPSGGNPTSPSLLHEETAAR